MNSISIFCDYMGEDITPSCVERLIQAPEGHIGALVQLYASYYYDWLENEEARTNDAVDTQSVSNDNREQTYYCIDPLDYHRPWREKLETYKKYLLYFPHFVVPDPVAEFLWPPVTAAVAISQISRGEGGLIVNDNFKQGFQDALLLLTKLAPAVAKNDIVLMPRTFASDYEVVQDEARKEVEAIERDEEYWRSLYDDAPSQYKAYQDWMKMLVGSVKVDGQLCSRFEFTPIAGQDVIHAILKQDYNRGIHYLSAPNKAHRTTQTLLRYDVLGLEKITFERAIALRNNEGAFYEWRREFGKILDKAQSEQPADEKQFEVEFREAADELLSPRIEEMEKAAKTSVLEKTLVPASMTLGAGVAAFYVAGLSIFPATAISGAALAPLSWVVDKVRKRFNKGGRKAAILREFYGYLLEKNS